MIREICTQKRDERPLYEKIDMSDRFRKEYLSKLYNLSRFPIVYLSSRRKMTNISSLKNLKCKAIIKSGEKNPQSYRLTPLQLFLVCKSYSVSLHGEDTVVNNST